MPVARLWPLSLAALPACDSGDPVSPDDPVGPDVLSRDRDLVDFLFYTQGFAREDIVVRDSFVVYDGDMRFDKSDIVAVLQANPRALALALARAGDEGSEAAVRLLQGTFETGPLTWNDSDGLGSSTSGIPVYVRSAVPTYWRTAIESALANWNSYSSSKVRFSYAGVNDGYSGAAVYVAGIPGSSFTSTFGANARAAADPPVNGVLDGDAAVRVDSETQGFGSATLTGFFVHELGHVVGLYHTDKVAAGGRQIPRTPRPTPARS